MIKNLPTKKRPGYGGLTGKYLKKNNTGSFQIIPKTIEGEAPSKLLYKARIILMLKLDGDI